MNTQRLSRTEALACVGMVLIALGVLSASWLLGDEAGVTEGAPALWFLKPCAFKAYTGIPCPTCGWTGAFAHISRARLGHAFIVQPIGALLAIVVYAAAVFCIWCIILRKSPAGILSRVPWRVVGLVAAIIFVAGWVYAIWAGR